MTYLDRGRTGTPDFCAVVAWDAATGARRADVRLRRSAPDAISDQCTEAFPVEVLGVVLGEAAGDPAALGLDAAFPAGLLALLLPVLRDPRTRRYALLGAAVAVLSTPLLPPGLPVLLALAPLAWGVRA